MMTALEERALNGAIAKTIKLVSPDLGHFIRVVNAFLTRMNGSTFGHWSKFVNDMIGLFQAWFPLLVRVGATIRDLFLPAVGLGKDFAKFLTTLLGTFDKFLRLKGTQQLLHSLFSAHMVELLQGFGGVLKASIPLLEAFLKAMVAIEIVFRSGLTVILRVVSDALSALLKHPMAATILGWAVAVGVLVSAMSPWSLAITAVIAAIGLLALHWHRIWTDIKNWFMDAYHAIDSALHAIPGWILALVAPLLYVALHWKEIWAEAKAVWHDILAFFLTLPAKMLSIGKDIIDGLWHGITGAAHHVIDAAKHVASDIWHAVTSFFGIFSPSKLMMGVGNTIVEGLSKGVIGAHSHIAAAKKINQDVLSALTPSLPTHGYEIGLKFDAQMAKAILAGKTQIVQAVTTVIREAVGAGNAQIAGIGTHLGQVVGRLKAGTVMR